MGEFTKPLQDIYKDATEYADLKITEVKLRSVKGLSIAMSRLIVAVILVSIVNLILMAIGFGTVLVLGDILGSYAAGAFIVAGIFIAILITIFCLRKKLFLSSFLKMFLGLFFSDDETID